MQNDFLSEEVMCDFTVSEKRKKIWQVQLALIEQLDIVCKKYGLRYFASNGTLLGVVRHEGFVPWDDDVDIVMPREDYEKLIEVGEQEFRAPLFLQSGANDPGYYRNYLRLRNCETTAIPLKDWNRQGHHGIFIDIFPMDGCSPSKFRRKWQQLWVAFYNALANTYVYYPDFKNYLFLRKMLYLLAKGYCNKHGYKGLVAKVEAIRSRVPFKEAEVIYMITHGSRWMIFPKEYFAESLRRPFEYIQLPIPGAYEKILVSHYGAYMELPPKEKRGVHHEIFFDPDKSYKEYMGVMPKAEAERLLNNY